MRENLVLYGVIALVVVVLAFAFISINNASNDSAKYNEFVSKEQSDICATPPGYTDQQWIEHMGHHPDRYAKCLK